MDTIQPYVLGWLIPSILSGLSGFLFGLLKKAKKDRELAEKEREEERKRAKEEQDELRRLLKSTALTSFRIGIYDEHFSVDEKVETYRMYRDLGGNHQTKKYMDELLGEDADAYLARHE